MSRLRQLHHNQELLIHLNINSLQNKIEELRLINEKLRASILLLTETKIDSTYPNSQFRMVNYRLFREDRVKGGGGVLAYVKHGIAVKRVRLPRVYKTLEAIALDVKLGNNSYIVLGIYRPPRSTSASYYLEVEEELSSLHSWALLQRQSVISLGDLNLDRLKPNTIEGKILIDLEDIYQLTCLIKEPTRKKALLDVVLTNNEELFDKAGAMEIGISDHQITYAFMKSKVKQYPVKVITFRSSKKLDNEAFRTDLHAEMRSLEFNDTMSAQDQYDCWNNGITRVLDKHMPIKKMRVRVKDAPYMTREWKEAIRKKRKYAKRNKKLQTVESEQEMKKWRNIATRIRRNAIKQYWKEKSDDLKANPRSFFKTFTPFLRDNSYGDTAISLKEDDTIVQDQNEVTELFANYFATIADSNGPASIASPTAHHPSTTKIHNRWSGNEFTFRKVSRAEVLEALEKLNPHKATGHDLISPSILRMVADEIATPLTSIFNQIITKGIWPEDWKWGEWVPVFKKDDPLVKSNYRPVTILTTANKVFEQLISGQLRTLSNKVFDIFNSAYRQSYSCETTLVRMVEDWKRALDNNQVVGVLSTDMSKAFDSMVPSLLLSKLKAYGLTDSSLAVLESYFTERKNRARLGNIVSKWKPVNRGCPQGSSLGPVLWNLYQNDVFYENIRSQLSAYADDHQLYLSDKETSKVISGLEEDGETTAAWYKANHLSGNLMKYQVTVMTRMKSEEETNEVLIDNHSVRQSPELKLLGVVLDDNLNFSQHIKSICVKTSRRIGVLSRLRNLIPTEAKLAIYKSAVLPHFNYCSLVWHFCKASDRRKLERTNERGLRTVYNDWSLSYQELLKRAGMTSLYNKRLQDIAIFMYKVKNNLVPRTVLELFNPNTSKYNFRNSDFKIDRFNTIKYGKHTLSYFGPYLWSKLSKQLRSHPSISGFKRAIRKIDVEGLTSTCRECSLCSN